MISQRSINLIIKYKLPEGPVIGKTFPVV